jgi:hypothetical protein
MNPGTVSSIDSIGSLQAFSGSITAPYNFEVQGYTAPGDGGGGSFVYVPGPLSISRSHSWVEPFPSKDRIFPAIFQPR